MINSVNGLSVYFCDYFPTRVLHCQFRFVYLNRSDFNGRMYNLPILIINRRESQREKEGKEINGFGLNLIIVTKFLSLVLGFTKLLAAF